MNSKIHKCMKKSVSKLRCTKMFEKIFPPGICAYFLEQLHETIKKIVQPMRHKPKYSVILVGHSEILFQKPLAPIFAFARKDTTLNRRALLSRIYQILLNNTYVPLAITYDCS